MKAPAKGKTVAVVATILGLAVLLMAGLSFNDFERYYRGRKSAGTEEPPAGGPGYYVQVQSMVLAAAIPEITSHLKSLGFDNIVTMSMLPVLSGRQRIPPNVTQSFIIRLGPYPSKDAASEAKSRFDKLIASRPLGRRRWLPFIFFEDRPRTRRELARFD